MLFFHDLALNSRPSKKLAISGQVKSWTVNVADSSGKLPRSCNTGQVKKWATGVVAYATSQQNAVKAAPSVAHADPDQTPPADDEIFADDMNEEVEKITAIV